MVVRTTGPRRSTLSTHLRLLRRRRPPYINHHYKRLAMSASSITFPTLGTLSPQPYLDRVMKIIERFSPKDKDVHLIYKAFRLAWEKHGGVERKNILYPYIEHSLQVAELVASVNGTAKEVAGSLLHDTQEDTDVEKTRIANEFGEEIAEMVDAVSKFESDIELDGEQLKVETIKKLIQYVVKQGNLSAVKIKLADRLVNARDFETLFKEDQEKTKKKAEETLYVYARLAKSLGIWNWSRELEDLAFEYINPKDFKAIKQRRGEIIAAKRSKIHEFASKLVLRLMAPWIRLPKVKVEERRVYEIYQRMQRWNIKLEDLDQTDIFRVNIIVAKEEDCYVMLGRLGKFYPPMQAGNEGTRWAFRDYVAEAHPNGHRLLHVYSKGIPELGTLLFQIRDQEMWQQYQFGVIAGVKQKGIELEEILGFLQLLLLDLKKRNVSEMTEVYRSLFREGARMPVYTPQGDVKYISIGSTPLDFAFVIHEELLLCLKAARINGKPAGIFDAIPYGATVRIITDKEARPQLDWHDHAVDPDAQAALRQYFASRDPGVIIADAKRELQKELDKGKYFIPVDRLLDSGLFYRYLSSLNITKDDLLVEIGTARRKAEQVIADIREIYFREEVKAKGGPWEFSPDEFKAGPLRDINVLIERIKEDFADLLDLQEEPIQVLNNVLHRADLYDLYKDKFSKHRILPEDMLQLIEITQEYRGESFGLLSVAMQHKIVQLNRLVLEHAYPHLCPVKPPGWIPIPYFIAINMFDRKGLISDLSRGLTDLGFNLYSSPVTEIEGKRITIVFAPEIFGEYASKEQQRVIGGGTVGQMQRIQLREFARVFAGKEGTFRILTIDEVIKYAEQQLDDLRYLRVSLTRRD